MSRHHMTRHLLGCSLVLGLAFSGSALAEDAYTAKSSSLRAGPGRDYPLVAHIPAGRSVEVAGCLDDYAWCDVVAGRERGWMYSGNLEYPYEDRRVSILSEGPALGFPIVAYSPGVYWDNYYRGRPWYGRRDYWVGRPYASHHAWVRSSVVAPGYRHSGPGPRPFDHRRDSRPVVARPYAHGPRPEVVRPAHVEARRPAERRPVEVRPANRPHEGRPNRGHDEKKRGPGRD